MHGPNHGPIDPEHSNRRLSEEEYEAKMERRRQQEERIRENLKKELEKEQKDEDQDSAIERLTREVAKLSEFRDRIVPLIQGLHRHDESLDAKIIKLQAAVEEAEDWEDEEWTGQMDQTRDKVDRIFPFFDWPLRARRAFSLLWDLLPTSLQNFLRKWWWAAILPFLGTVGFIYYRLQIAFPVLPDIPILP